MAIPLAPHLIEIDVCCRGCTFTSKDNRFLAGILKPDYVGIAIVFVMREQRQLLSATCLAPPMGAQSAAGRQRRAGRCSKPYELREDIVATATRAPFFIVLTLDAATMTRLAMCAGAADVGTVIAPNNLHRIRFLERPHDDNRSFSDQNMSADAVLGCGLSAVQMPDGIVGFDDGALPQDLRHAWARATRIRRQFESKCSGPNLLL